jgi:superoxide dismutase, Fe-Mn family
MDRRQLLKSFALGVPALALSSSWALAETPAPAPVAAPAATPSPGPFVLPPLGYAVDALEPFLDAATMTLHHDKHHAAYVNNLNKAVAQRAEVAGWSIERLLRDLAQVPEDIRGVVRNHGGGHHNHTLLWESLAKSGARVPSGELARAIDASFGSFTACQDKLTAAGMSVFGSGWAWLSAEADGRVRIETTPQQDSPLTSGRTPLLGIDVWEHAYYLKFQNRRAEYLAAFGSVVDWDVVSARYRALKPTGTTR